MGRSVGGPVGRSVGRLVDDDDDDDMDDDDMDDDDMDDG